MRCSGWVALAVAVAVAGCEDETSPLDGGADGAISEDASVTEAGQQTALQFTINGCQHLEIRNGGPHCVGRPPLTVTFVPLSFGLTTFAWSFAGGTPTVSAELTPSVTFAGIGEHTVTLGGGGSGGTQTAKGVVEVTTGAVGEPCVYDTDCTGGLSCFCGFGRCTGALMSGVCSRPCSGLDCVAGEVCADFSRGRDDAPDGGYTTLIAPLCLSSCTSSASCRAGFSCVEVPGLQGAAGPGGAFSWQRVCAPSNPAPVGASCYDEHGNPDDARCISGLCAAYGARGICTLDCGSASCPTHAACATFAGGGAGQRCLVRCDATHPCDDPLLQCTVAGGTGNLGFTVPAGDPAGTMYCAPKRCTMSSDCTPSGTCTVMGAASFCVRN